MEIYLKWIFQDIMPNEFPLTDQMAEALGVKPLETYLNRDLVLY